jgi:altronate dehydratase small subunit
MASSEPRAAAMKLAPQDNVAVALRALAAGETVMLGDAPVRIARDIAVGHKLAARPIAAGEKIVKYNCPIGSASVAIAAGDYVHTHNVASDYLPACTLPE